VASFDEVIPPGKAGTIKASVHTANYKGSIGKSVTVTHDDASQGPITLSVLAKIVGSVEVLPYPALQIARHRRGFEEPALLLVRKDATEEGKFALTGLAASSPWLKISARKVTGDEPAVEGIPPALAGDVVISVQAVDPPVGTHAETLTFKTGLKREPQVTIPVTVMVQPAVSLNNNDLILTPTAAAPDGASGQVLASLRDDVDPKSVAVTSDAPGFKVHVEPPGEPSFRVIVDWERKGKDAPTETVIHIKAGQETTDLRVRINMSAVAGKAS
jgi:hypothetical protein